MKIQTVYLITEHFDSALNFYRHILQARESLIMPWGHGDDRVAFFELENFRFMLSYESRHDFTGQRQSVWLELDHEDPRAFVEELSAFGIHPVEPLQVTPAGSLAFSVRDPDGNTVRIGTRWALPQG